LGFEKRISKKGGVLVLGKNKKRRRFKPTPIAHDPVIEDVAPVALPQKFDGLAVAEVICLLLLPVAAFWMMRFIPINQNNYLDPYVYTGYIHNFQDLIARYGLTYYSVRFGMIVPAQALTRLFGPVGGYFTFRYLLALTAGVPLYYMVKSKFSTPVAVLAVVGMITSPYFARALLWDYPDAAGVPFLVAAICLVLWDDRPSLHRDALAGGSAAMAVNSNFFLIALVGIFSAVWLSCYLLFRRPPQQLVKRIGAVALGGFIVCFLGCVYYWHAFGRPTNIFYPSIGMAFAQAKGGAARWRTPGVAWMATQIQVVMPIFLAVCGVLIIRWGKITFASAVALSFGIAATGFFYLEQFVLNSNILQFFYYFSYLAAAMFLMLAFLWQILWQTGSLGPGTFLGLGMTALLGPWLLVAWGGWSPPSVSVSRWMVLAGLTAAMMLLGTREWRLPLVRTTMSALALVALCGFFTTGLANYNGAMRRGLSTNNVEMDVYRVTMQFMHVVPKITEHPGAIRFWYNNRVGNSINSVQSTYLWGYSKVNANLPEDPGLPYLGESNMKLLSDPEVRYLGLLCESEEELSKGLAALRQRAVSFRTADYRVLASGDYRIYYQLVELTHLPGTVTH